MNPTIETPQNKREEEINGPPEYTSKTESNFPELTVQNEV